MKDSVEVLKGMVGVGVYIMMGGGMKDFIKMVYFMGKGNMFQRIIFLKGNGLMANMLIKSIDLFKIIYFI